MGLQTATNPTTGERVVLVGGQWQPITQSATNKQGVKAYLVGDKWLTDDAPAAATPSPDAIPTRRELALREFRQFTAPIAGFSSGVGNVMFGGQELLGMGLEKLGATDTGRALIEDAARRRAIEQERNAPMKREFPMRFGAGELGAEVLATAPVSGAIAAPVSKFAPALGQAIRTGGFSTGRTATTAGQRAVDLGTRVAGGAITGGATAALINPAEAETGALTGAGVAALAPTAVNLLAKGAGKIADARQMPNQLAVCHR